MHLLGVIIHREELLDEVLSLLVELELPHTIVVDSRSGLELLERDLPIFAGLRSLIPAGIDFNRLVLCVVEEAGGQDVLRRISQLGPKKAKDPPNLAFLVPVSAIERF
jgi:hypothetical protein